MLKHLNTKKNKKNKKQKKTAITFKKNIQLL